MKITNSTFKLRKPTKRLLARYTNSHKEGEFKRLMILSQRCAEISDQKPTGGSVRDKSEG